MIFSERMTEMGYMKEKYTEAQETLYSSYIKLLEARDILQAKTLREEDMLERYAGELTKLSSGIEFAAWLFEKSELFREFGLDILHEATYVKEENVSDTQETGA